MVRASKEHVRSCQALATPATRNSLFSCPVPSLSPGSCDSAWPCTMQDEARRASDAEAAVARAREQHVRRSQALAALARREGELDQGIRGGLTARRNSHAEVVELKKQVCGWS